jgi:hypothetical protein
MKAACHGVAEGVAGKAGSRQKYEGGRRKAEVGRQSAGSLTGKQLLFPLFTSAFSIQPLAFRRRKPAVEKPFAPAGMFLQ